MYEKWYERNFGGNTYYRLGCQIDTFCVKITQFDVAWHNRWKCHSSNKKMTHVCHPSLLFLNGNKRKVKFQVSTSRKAIN